ncbi:hypothetical protein E4656_16780 [Natronospirillum operosum]|uniref:Lipoprotein n=1 Tax=Natronospirillum operosum TaxID=2759953 RepID=A0A4Z0WAI5_9GAMM|nr:hypothetical protein [Natronospirillum operosum]TGG91371.1 hypothetical protein E4656_16780 [Natronospirillum operosum]
MLRLRRPLFRVITLAVLLILGSCVANPDWRDVEDYWRYDDLYDFAYLVCMAETHRNEGRVPLANALDGEAWRFVERGDFPGRTYVRVLAASRSYAYRVPSGDSSVGCARWKRSQTLHHVIILSFY